MRGRSGRRRTAVAVTMVRDEGFLLPRWVEYYGAAVGERNLVVIDDSSTDGSTDALPGSTLLLPQYVIPKADQGTSEGFAGRRAQMVSALAAALLDYYDVVVYTDVDEFLVPHPRSYESLAHYLDVFEDPVVAGVGLNSVHNLSAEGALDPSAGILEQRRFVKFVPNMCKPLVTRVPLEWTSGFHGCSARYRVDPELLQVHLKFFDATRAVENQRVRHRQYREGRGGPRSTWRLSVHKAEREMREWMSPSEPVEPLETTTLPLEVVRTVSPEGPFVSVGGNQRTSMRDGRFLQLPESIRHQF